MTHITSLSTHALHDAHAAASSASATAPSSSSLAWGRVGPVEPAGRLGLRLLTGWVPDCLVHTQDRACGLGGGSQHI